IRGGTTPARCRVPPGDYLVVAYFNESDFHEVFRRVPLDPAATPGGYPHTQWTLVPDGTLVLPSIKIPTGRAVLEGMAECSGAEDFEMGDVRFEELPPHHRRVAGFFIDSTEVTIEMHHEHSGLRPAGLAEANLSDKHPMRLIMFDQALAFAESIGKRLPDEG